MSVESCRNRERKRTLASVDSDGLHAFEQQIFLDIYTPSFSITLIISQNDNVKEQPTIDLVLILTEDDNRRRSLLQTFKQINHLRLLLDILNDLQDVQISSTCPRSNKSHTSMSKERTNERRKKKKRE